MGIGTDMALWSAAMATSPIWGYRLLATGKWRTDWPARFGRCDPVNRTAKRSILIHAVSVGETNAVRTLVDAIQHDTNWQIICSSTTDTGIERARHLFEPRHRVVRYPLDLTRSVNRFLDATDPDLVALVELEVWPNFTEACRRRKIPVCVINGRLSDTGFPRYRLIRPLARAMFAGLSAVGAQTRTYADRFEALGVPASRVHVLDTMKWDTAQIADHVDGAEALATAMGIDRRRPLIVAGSTAPGEEKLLVETCPTHAQILFAPRKPEWFDAAATVAPGVVRRTDHRGGTPRPCDGTRFFLLDTIGELRKAYSLANVAVVGRSFLGLYGSDMIEPIALGKPTLVGPHHQNFADAVDALSAGGGLEVTDAPGRVAGALLDDPDRASALATRGRNVIRARQGATGRHLQMLRSAMPADDLNETSPAPGGEAR